MSYTKKGDGRALFFISHIFAHTIDSAHQLKANKDVERRSSSSKKNDTSEISVLDHFKSL